MIKSGSGLSKERRLNVFVCPKHKATVIAYNRGHAVKLLAKELSKQGIIVLKSDEVIKLVTDQAQVVLMGED